MIWNKKNQFKPGKRKRIEYYLMITQPQFDEKGNFSKLLIKDYKLMAKKGKEKKIVQTENPKIQK